MIGTSIQQRQQSYLSSTDTFVSDSTRPSSFGQARRFSEMAGLPQNNNTIPGLRRTVWNQIDLKAEYPKLEQDLSTDVVIVGGGIAGLNIAYNLVKEGKNVVVLEARCIGAGQTGRTTAHIMPWYDDFYYKMEKMHGSEIAKQVADSYGEVIGWYEKVIEEEGIECHFARVNGYLFPHDKSPETYSELTKEFEACKRLGVRAEMANLNEDPAHGKIGSCIVFPTSGEFHPLMYIRGLAKAIAKRGGKIFEQSSAFNIGRNEVSTVDGHTVKASAVVMATNSPLNHNLLVHARQRAYHSYVVGLEIPKGSIPKAQWWDISEEYHYVRTEQKEDFDVLIVGGEDTSTGMKPTDYHDAYTNLEKWAKDRWTAAGRVLYTWTGQVFEPADSLHLIGLDPWEKASGNHYIATGDSGQGITGSAIAGILIKDLILKGHNPWAKAYDPARHLPITSKPVISGVFEEAVHTVQGMKDITPFVGTETVDIEDLKPHGGCVIQNGLSKIAVYKDEQGNVHKYSAVCPHLKCIVKWNPIDSTFDCPCHGSIFDYTGVCINGPAKANLSPLD